MGVAIFKSDKLYFKAKTIIKDKECHYIIIMGCTQQKDRTFVDICASNIEVFKYIKWILTNLNGEIVIQ